MIYLFSTTKSTFVFTRYAKAEADPEFSAFHVVNGVNVSCKPIQVFIF